MDPQPYQMPTPFFQFLKKFSKTYEVTSHNEKALVPLCKLIDKYKYKSEQRSFLVDLQTEWNISRRAYSLLTVRFMWIQNPPATMNLHDILKKINFINNYICHEGNSVCVFYNQKHDEFGLKCSPERQDIDMIIKYVIRVAVALFYQEPALIDQFKTLSLQEVDSPTSSSDDGDEDERSKENQVQKMYKRDCKNGYENLALIDLSKAELIGQSTISEDSQMNVMKALIKGAKIKGTCENCFHGQMETKEIEHIKPFVKITDKNGIAKIQNIPEDIRNQPFYSESMNLFNLRKLSILRHRNLANYYNLWRMTEKCCCENFIINKQNMDLFTIYGEFYEGQTLDQYAEKHIKDHIFDFDVLFSIGRQILSAFLAFEKLDCINLDIKPSNIIIQNKQSEQMVKIIDYRSLVMRNPNDLSPEQEQDAFEKRLKCMTEAEYGKENFAKIQYKDTNDVSFNMFGVFKIFNKLFPTKKVPEGSGMSSAFQVASNNILQEFKKAGQFPLKDKQIWISEWIKLFLSEWTKYKNKNTPNFEQ